MSNTCGPKQHKNVLAQCWRSGCGKQTAVEWYVAADWRSGSVLDGGCRAHGCRAYMELSGNTARDNNSKDTISPRHIYLAIENDEEIHRCLANVVIRDGGVLPNILSFLLPPPTAPKCPVSKEPYQHQGKAKRSKIATRKARDLEIVKQYRSEHPWASSPAGSVTSPASHLSLYFPDFTFVYPEGEPIFWEQRFNDMLEQAAGGVLIDPSDGRHYLLARQKVEPPWRHPDNDMESESDEFGAVPRPAPQFDQGTLGSQQVAALELLSAKDRAAFDRREVSLTSLLRGVRVGQRETRRIIASEVFRKLAEGSTANVHFTAEALDALQSAMEGHLLKLLGEANLTATHARRFCIEPMDLHIARRIRGERA